MSMINLHHSQDFTDCDKLCHSIRLRVNRRSAVPFRNNKGQVWSRCAFLHRIYPVPADYHDFRFQTIRNWTKSPGVMASSHRGRTSILKISLYFRKIPPNSQKKKIRGVEESARNPGVCKLVLRDRPCMCQAVTRIRRNGSGQIDCKCHF